MLRNWRKILLLRKRTLFLFVDNASVGLFSKAKVLEDVSINIECRYTHEGESKSIILPMLTIPVKQLIC